MGIAGNGNAPRVWKGEQMEFGKLYLCALLDALSYDQLHPP